MHQVGWLFAERRHKENKEILNVGWANGEPLTKDNLAKGQSKHGLLWRYSPSTYDEEACTTGRYQGESVRRIRANLQGNIKHANTLWAEFTEKSIEAQKRYRFGKGLSRADREEVARRHR